MLIDATRYLMELLFFYDENLRSVVLSHVGHHALRCLRQLGGLGFLRGVVPWLLGGSEDPWLSVPVFRQVWRYIGCEDPPSSTASPRL